MAINIVCKPLSMLLSYIYVPLVMCYLGDEKYGIWSVFLSITSWFSSFDLGIGNGLRNRLTESITKGDKIESKKIVSSAYAFISSIMLLVIAIVIIISLILDWNKLLNTNIHYSGLPGVMIIISSCILFNFIVSLCNSVLYALQKSHIVAITVLINQIFNVLIIYFVSFVDSGKLLVVALVEGGMLVFTNLIASFALYKKYDFLKPSLSFFDKKLGKSVMNLGLRFFIVQIAALVLFSTDNIIVSHLYGAVYVTSYSIIIKLYNSVLMIQNTLIIPFWSSITSAKTALDYKKIKNNINCMVFSIIPFAVLAVFLCIFFVPISIIWLGHDLNFNIKVIYLGLLYCVLNLWCNTIGNVASGLGIMEQFSKIAIVQAVINIPASLFFAVVLDLKEFGVLLGTILAMSISAIAIPFEIKKDICKIKESNLSNNI